MTFAVGGKFPCFPPQRPSVIRRRQAVGAPALKLQLLDYDTGKEIFAVYAPAGAGRVVYVRGPAYGEAPAGKTAFWDTEGWQEAAIKLLGWLGRGK